MRRESGNVAFLNSLRVDLGTFNNAWYHPGPLVRRVLWYCVSAGFFDTRIPWPAALKIRFLRLFGAHISGALIIKPHVHIKYPWFLTLGNQVWLGENAWIDNPGHVTIGDNVCISQGAYIVTGNHDYRSTAFDLNIQPVVIEDGVWIGARSVVCPGAVLKSHCVLSVGSVFSRTSEAWTIYQGNPARAIRRRSLRK